MSRSQKRLFRECADFVDDVVEERMEREGVAREKLHGGIIYYVRELLNSMKDDNDANEN